MARGAVVVILSDGWDRGDPEVLAEQMARLHRVAHRIVWVNPLKATPGYAPLAAGMAAALPYVDEFVEGHSLASLEDLVDGDRADAAEAGDEGGARRHRAVAGRAGTASRSPASSASTAPGPRDPGATMVVNDAGEVAGLGVGRVRRGRGRHRGARGPRRRARAAASSRFGYSDDEAFAVGLTCGGTVHLFVEPLDW